MVLSTHTIKACVTLLNRTIPGDACPKDEFNLAHALHVPRRIVNTSPSISQTDFQTSRCPATPPSCNLLIHRSSPHRHSSSKTERTQDDMYTNQCKPAKAENITYTQLSICPFGTSVRMQARLPGPDSWKRSKTRANLADVCQSCDYIAPLNFPNTTLNLAH